MIFLYWNSEWLLSPKTGVESVPLGRDPYAHNFLKARHENYFSSNIFVACSIGADTFTGMRGYGTN
jgi:hypothetical protein